MYKVTSDYDPPSGDEFLQAEKGDILINGEFLDGEWFRGENTITTKRGKIPCSYVEEYSTNARKSVKSFSAHSDFEAFELQPTGKTQEREESEGESEELFFDKDDSNVFETTVVDQPEQKVRRESNYVEMSSDETINTIDQNVVNPVPKPPRASEGTKLSDEGYNSGSYYSGEANETTQPLLTTPAISKQDEAGYEVPQISIDVPDVDTTKSDDGKGKRRLLRGIFRTRSMDTKSANKVDDMQEKYYNPPADIRDNYFLPKSRCPIVRVLLSLIAALAVAFTALFVLLISLDPLLSFVISFVLFIVVFVVPVTLLHQGFVCVLALVFPSMFSTRTKIAGLLLATVLLIIGPILGVADKFNVAITCTDGLHYGPSNSRFVQQSFTYNTPSVSTNLRRLAATAMLTGSTLEEECRSSFLRVHETCGQSYDVFKKKCKSQDRTSESDSKLCGKSKEEFCYKNTTIVSACFAYSVKDLNKTTETIRSVFIYLIPLLILFLLSDAYIYNKVYLTTKNADNIYITQRLKQLDCERKNRGLTDLILPLTRIEFQTYLVRGRFVFSKQEKYEMLKWFGVLMVFGIMSLVCILMEEYLHLTFSSSLVGQCKALYEANATIRYRVFIYTTLGVMLFIIILQSYVLRLRSIICDHFYTDMVDIRAKHLYYKILHDRHSFARHIRRKIQLLAEAKRLTRRISCSNMIYHTLPSRLKWCCTKLSIKRCMICDSVTYWKTIECREATCQAHYCYECYVDAGQLCLTCKIPNSPPPAPTSLPVPVAV